MTDMATTDAVTNIARARVAAGALFVRGDDILLVHKVYGNGWDIPGGYLEPGESPSAGCRREVREELGIDRLPGRLLVHDWAPGAAEGDKILYVFDGGELGAAAEQSIVLQAEELDRWQWVDVDALDEFVVPRLGRRLRWAHRAHGATTACYLEHGAPAAVRDEDTETSGPPTRSDFEDR